MIKMKIKKMNLYGTMKHRKVSDVAKVITREDKELLREAGIATRNKVEEI
jgi:hypothetical protein